MAEPLLIGCYTPDQGGGAGISVAYREGGVLSRVGRTVATDSPSFVIRHPELPVVYAVAETSTGAVLAWEIDGDGPRRPLGRGDTGGTDPCHLTVDASGQFLVTVNYTSGSVAVHRLAADGRILARTDLVHHERHGSLPRQAGAHPHMVRDVGAELLVTDLGGDAIYRYHLDDGRLVRDGLIETPPGTGPRHLIRSGGRWLVTAELSASVLVFSADWRLLGQVPATRSTVECLPSELVADDRFLYVANRGPDTVSVFRIDAELPAYVTEVPVGRDPRHMARDGNLLYVANQQSDDVMTMRLDPETGVPEPVGSLATPSPTCVLVR